MTKKDSSSREDKTDCTSETSRRRLGSRLVYSGRRRDIIDPHFKRLSRYMVFYYSERESDYSSDRN